MYQLTVNIKQRGTVAVIPHFMGFPQFVIQGFASHYPSLLESD
jgi:hypothetical protein